MKRTAFAPWFTLLLCLMAVTCSRIDPRAVQTAGHWIPSELRYSIPF